MLIFLGIISSFGQNHHKNDSILKVCIQNIYEKPNDVIKAGTLIYQNNQNSIADRVNAALIISDAYSSRRDYQKALTYFAKAKDLVNQSNNTDMQIKVLNKGAIKYQQLRVYDKAMQYLDQADKLLSATPITKDSLKVSRAINYIVRGFIYKEQLNCEIGINYFNKGIAACLNVKNIAVQPTLSIATYNKGNCYILLGDYARAKESFLISVKYADSINAKSLKAFAQKGLAQVYTLEGNYTQAIAALENAREVSKGVGDLILNREIYKGLADNYLAINERQKYQQYHKKFIRAQLETMESERISISESINEFTLLQNQKKATLKTYFTYKVLVILFAILLTVFLLYKYQMRSLKMLKLLEERVKNLKNERGFPESKN